MELRVDLDPENPAERGKNYVEPAEKKVPAVVDKVKENLTHVIHGIKPPRLKKVQKNYPQKAVTKKFPFLRE